MKYASYLLPNGDQAFGAVTPDGSMLSDLRDAGVPALRAALTMWRLDGLAQRAARADYTVPAASVRWLQPITDPAKIICVGLNYRTHAAEAAREVPKHPSLFVRFADSQVGHLEPVVAPWASTQFDYEAELAVVIGKAARHVSAVDALDHVAGYSCFAENSVRDFQKHAAQATPGKNFHASGAFGPWITTPDEIGDLEKVEVIGRLNGEVMQRDTIEHLVFPIPELIAYISTFTPLLPGDVIATGTPAGVGSARKPPVFMRQGDTFVVEIPGVGTLRNKVVDEPRR
jgi:2-keto-4-pentenoate hydratase/2-oxohepta-3-ene-1,7-dioic acid hydratase in catechol pathway